MKTRLVLAATLAALAACSTAGNKGDDVEVATCGDGVIEGSEMCDDGNVTGGDGCSATCQAEASATCGDGFLGGAETCDDSNLVSGDGCSASCTVETGFDCTGTPSVCVAGGGGTCGAPNVLTLAANGADLEATGMGDTTASTDQVAEGLCDGFDSGAGHDQVWQFTLTDKRDVVVMIDEANTTFDSVLRVMSAPCDIATEIPEYGTEDGCSDGEGATEFLGYVSLDPGTYYIVVDGYTATDIGAYQFHFLAMPTTCGDGILDPLEFCDDGDSASGNGCNAKCEVEPGYTCDGGEPSVCTGGSSMAMPPAPGDLVLNEFMAADNASDTNCDGSTSGTADEFVELVNVSSKTLDLATVTLSDSVTVRHTFAAGTTLPPGQAFVVWNAGAPACPGVTRFAIASEGQLGLNDGGDTITLDLGTVNLLTMTYPAQTANVSSNLSPELTGTTYALHNAMTGAMGSFSPGLRATGAAF